MASKTHDHVDFCLTRPYFCRLWNFVNQSGIKTECLARYSFIIAHYESHVDLGGESSILCEKPHQHVEFCGKLHGFCSLWLFMEQNGLSSSQLAGYAQWLRDFEENPELLDIFTWRQGDCEESNLQGGGRPKSMWGQKK